MEQILKPNGKGIAMSKGLEALEYIKHNYLPYCNSEDYGDENCCSEWYEPHKYLDIIYKELKALEAIKRNPMLIIHLLTNNATYKHVVEVTNESERPTQEEYDLLKEVLENEKR